jgi:hypothetical protein
MTKGTLTSPEPFSPVSVLPATAVSATFNPDIWCHIFRRCDPVTVCRLRSAHRSFSFRGSCREMLLAFVRDKLRPDIGGRSILYPAVACFTWLLEQWYHWPARDRASRNWVMDAWLVKNIRAVSAQLIDGIIDPLRNFCRSASISPSNLEVLLERGLAVAIARGNKEMVSLFRPWKDGGTGSCCYLLTPDYLVEQFDHQYDWKALVQASQVGNLEIVRLLMATETDPSTLYRALLQAVKLGDYGMVKLLAEHAGGAALWGESIEGTWVPDGEKYCRACALNVAARRGRRDIVEYLLDTGVFQPEIAGGSAANLETLELFHARLGVLPASWLRKAVEEWSYGMVEEPDSGRPDVVEYLLRHLQPSFQELTQLVNKTGLSRLDLTEKLLMAGGSLDPSLLLAAVNTPDGVGIAKRLLAATAHNLSSSHVFCAAARALSPDIVQLLLDAGVDPTNETPLQAARNAARGKSNTTRATRAHAREVISLLVKAVAR